MSVATSTAIIIGGGLAAAGGVASSVIGSHAAGSAADKQVAADQQALEFQKQQYATNQANQAPFVSAGHTSIQKLIDSINNGTFGPGSLPTFQTPEFKLPTLEDAQKTPGYQFAQQQGELGINRGAAAAGGAFTGGTLKSLSEFNSGLATTTYQQQVQNALGAYQALLAGNQQNYNQLASAQQQGYNQIAGVASLGENAAANTGNAGIASGAQIGQTLGNIGTAQASGIVGSANAINSGIGSISNIAQTYGLLNATGQFSGSSGASGAQPNWVNGAPPPQQYVPQPQQYVTAGGG